MELELDSADPAAMDAARATIMAYATTHGDVFVVGPEPPLGKLEAMLRAQRAELYERLVAAHRLPKKA